MTQQQPAQAASFNQRIISEFRANGGAVGGMFEGATLVLITTAGRKTGRPHTNPAVYLPDGGRYLVFGSNLGSPKHPDWYHNLLASPQVTMEIGTKDGRVKPFATRAVILDGAERDRLYDLQCTINPAFRGYQEKTTRKIPVVALYPLDLSADQERNRMIGEQLIAHHNTLRADLSRVRAEIDVILGGKPESEQAGRTAADLTDQLRLHCLSYCFGLQMHHIREDGSFSAFEQQFPQLIPVINRLRAEHRVTERALADLEALVSRGLAGDITDVERLRNELDHVVSGLEDHFRYEEELLIPAVNETLR